MVRIHKIGIELTKFAGNRFSSIIYRDQTTVENLHAPVRAKTALRTHLRMTVSLAPRAKDDTDPTLDQLASLQIAKRSAYMKQLDELNFVQQ